MRLRGGAWQQEAGAIWPKTTATGSLGWQRGAFGMNLMTVFACASRHTSSYTTQDLQLSHRIKETEITLGAARTSSIANHHTPSSNLAVSMAATTRPGRCGRCT